MLAEQQSALMAALAGKGPVPDGFDATRVGAAAAALAFKRARGVAQAWPSLRAMLGDNFRTHFADYAATSAVPQQGGPLADGRRFARYLAHRMPLGDAARMQAVALDATHRLTTAGLVPRRLPALRLAWLPRSRALLVAFGGRLFRYALPRRAR